MFNFLNWYSASYSLLILGIIELAMVSWIYGKNSCTNPEKMAEGVQA